MKVYLDNNILVSLENGEYSLDKIKGLFPNSKIRFFYSSAHIFEAETFPGNTSITKSEFLTKRLQSIRNIFNNNYLFLNLKGNKLTYIIEDPTEVFNTITLVPSSIQAMKGFMNLISKEQKEEYRSKLGIELKKINNYSAADIIEHLNVKIANSGQSLSFMEMLDYAINSHPDGHTFGLHNRIAGVFELLDMLGYWKDKETSTSNYARLWDADHTHFASYCDYFISDDKKTRHKAHVVYNLYGKSTKIMSSNGEIINH